RHFDVLSQLSVGTADSVRILPVDVRFTPSAVAAEAAPGGPDRRSLLDYLPPEAVLVQLDARAEEEWERSWMEIQRLHQAETQSGARPEDPERIFLPPQRIRAQARSFPAISM